MYMNLGFTHFQEVEPVSHMRHKDLQSIMWSVVGYQVSNGQSFDIRVSKVPYHLSYDVNHVYTDSLVHIEYIKHCNLRLLGHHSTVHIKDVRHH